MKIRDIPICICFLVFASTLFAQQQVGDGNGQGGGDNGGQAPLVATLTLDPGNEIIWGEDLVLTASATGGTGFYQFSFSVLCPVDPNAFPPAQAVVGDEFPNLGPFSYRWHAKDTGHYRAQGFATDNAGAWDMDEQLFFVFPPDEITLKTLVHDVTMHEAAGGILQGWSDTQFEVKSLNTLVGDKAEGDAEERIWGFDDVEPHLGWTGDETNTNFYFDAPIIHDFKGWQQTAAVFRDRPDDDILSKNYQRVRVTYKSCSGDEEFVSIKKYLVTKTKLNDSTIRITHVPVPDDDN